MKNNNKAISIVLLGVLFLFAHNILAADYHLAAPLPGGGETATDFTQYMGYLFPFLLSVAAISALVMFIVGAIQYMLAGDGSTQGAKDRMINALGGLLLAVFSVIILQTINPELIKLELKLKPVGIYTPTYGPNDGPTNDGAACETNNQCSSGYCVNKVCAASNDDLKNNGELCSLNNQCKSGLCNIHGPVCANRGKEGDSCSQSNQKPCEDGLDCIGFFGSTCQRS